MKTDRPRKVDPALQAQDAAIVERYKLLPPMPLARAAREMDLRVNVLEGALTRTRTRVNRRPRRVVDNTGTPDRTDQHAVIAAPLEAGREVTIEPITWKEAMQWAINQKIASPPGMLKGDFLTILNERRAGLGLQLWEVREGGLKVVRGRLPAGVRLVDYADA
jgi:hypothetical protein